MPPVDQPRDPEVGLAIRYAAAAARPALTALWALDDQLASILRTTSDPMTGQLRLTWWHDALGRTEPVGGQPILAAVRDARFAMADLQRLVAGWEALLDEPTDATLTAYADGRAALFDVAAGALMTSAAVGDAGAGWALVDLARHHSSPAIAARALALARARLAAAPRIWSRAGRPLGLMTKLARRDLDGIEPQGSPRRIAAAVWLALTGR